MSRLIQLAWFACVSLASPLAAADTAEPSEPGTALFRQIMERNTTGKARIRARLPDGTVVGDNTGASGGSVNNGGVIALLRNREKLVLVVFIEESGKPFEDRERVFADVGRAIFAYYLFEPAE